MNATDPAKPIPEVTNRQHEREQEGFARTLGPESRERNEALRCATYPYGWPGRSGADSRGCFALPAIPARRSITWESSPAEFNESTVFTWMGASRVWPAFTPAFPYATATISVDGGGPLRFPIGRPDGFHVARDGLALSFEPRQFQGLAEHYHRTADAVGVSGFYRLHVDGRLLAPGRPLRLRVELGDDLAGLHASFLVVPRDDCLKVDLRILRDEVAQLQRELVMSRRSHEMLYAQMYPELFPSRIIGERAIVAQDEIKHLHPANISVMRDGEVVVTMREGTDHLVRDGRMMLVRSRDGGKTWGPRELMFDLGNVDHRCSPIVELPNGEWATTDYRPGDKDGIYDGQGVFRAHTITGPSVWGAWSKDRGPDLGILPGGFLGARFAFALHRGRAPHDPPAHGERLLVGAAYYSAPNEHHSTAVFASDDDARSRGHASPGWRQMAGPNPRPACCARARARYSCSRQFRIRDTAAIANSMLGCPSGCPLQSVSRDDGKTCGAPYRESGMSSLATPAHLLQLQDGRILCSHASRSYPGSIYVTTSSDEGETWDTARTRVIANDLTNFDTTYPTSCQLADGTIITTWYANLFGKYFIPALRYRPDQLG